jgi:DNA-binding beta-propeller fold protein YncE
MSKKSIAGALFVASIFVAVALAASPPSGAVPPNGTMLTLTWETGTLYSVDPSDASTTEIGTDSFLSSTGIAWDRTTETLFGIDYDPDPGNLYTIDPDTGEETLVGSLGINSATGLEADPDTGVLYTVYDEPGGGSMLATINKSTGAVTDIGETIDETEHVRISGIAISPIDGELYGYGYNSRFYRIEKETGLLSHIPVDEEIDGYGLAFDCSGVLYVSNADENGTLYTLDIIEGAPDSGEIEEVGTMSMDDDFSEDLTVICGVEPPPTTTSTTAPSTTSTTAAARPAAVTPRFTG